jgi:hypothetical protein
VSKSEITPSQRAIVERDGPALADEIEALIDKMCDNIGDHGPAAELEQVLFDDKTIILWALRIASTSVTANKQT